MNRPQDPRTSPPPHPLAAKEFSLQPNQRSKRTRLTLFWLCLLTLKTLKLDNLNVQYKTDSFDFTWIQTQNLTLPLLVFIHVCFFWFFLHLADSINETGRFTAMQYNWLITLRQTIHVAMGTSGEMGSQKITEKRGPVQFFCFVFFLIRFFFFYWSNIKPACWGKHATGEYRGSDSL